MPPIPRAPEEDMLRDALGLEVAAAVTMLSREPLGAGSVAGFAVALDPPQTYFVDTSGLTVPVETGMLAGTPEAPEARVWLHPADPHLPALAPVAFSDAAATLLARVGVIGAGNPEIVVYRAGRRAVLRIASEAETVWIKVVPPRRVDRIVRAHALLRAAGVAVPEVRAWSPEGLLVIAEAVGTPAAAAPWSPEGLLDEVDALRARLAPCDLGVPTRALDRRRVRWYLERLQAISDADSAALVRSVGAAVLNAGGGGGSGLTVHGDLHFGQLFLDDRGRISSVIDVDTAGSGRPADDAGAFIAHAIASAVLTPAPHDRRLWELSARALSRWEESDRHARPSAAAHLLGHALGAAERGERARADRLLTVAARVADGDRTIQTAPKNGLMDDFETP